MNIKLVAIDLDDTLLDSNLKISEKNRQVLKLVKEKGVNVTFATGRMFSLALPPAIELGIDIPLITYQGALVKKSQSNEILYAKTVPASLAKEVINLIKKYEYHCQIYLGDSLYMDKLTPEGMTYSKQLKVEPVLVNDLRTILTEDPLKIMVINNNYDQLFSLEKEMNLLFGKDVYIVKSKPNYLEVMNKKANKLDALKALARDMGIKREEVMAIGDSYTDLDIISWAGLGVAMANSIDDIVKQEANYITGTNDEDGVAEALLKFVLTENKNVI